MKYKQEQFINRELSWLNFNSRVLDEAEEESNPLLERLKFLGITSSNLEEFFMIRVAVLKKQKESSLLDGLPDRTPPERLLAIVRERVLEMIARQYRVLNTLVAQLAESGIHLLRRGEEMDNHLSSFGTIFDYEIKPLLTPLSVGPTHPFPVLVSGRLYLAVSLAPLPTNNLAEKSGLSFVELPISVLGRFWKLQDGESYVLTDCLIKRFIGRLFPGYEVLTAHTVRISRDADFSVQEDGAIDLIHEIESTIKRMHRRSAVKLEVETGLPGHVLSAIMEKNELTDADIYEIPGMLNLKDWISFCEKLERPDQKFPSVIPIEPQDFKNVNPFKVIEKADRLLLHPYQSYNPVVDLLQKAADDPDVLAIKQTLYRTSSDSAIIAALVRAAENGKYVSVVDELKARFDEKRNIEWAKKLEDAGAHVTYGVAGLKTHAKALIIVRRENGRIKRTVHMATGNYNESTARLYTDFSFFTSDENIGEDVSGLFNLLTGFSAFENSHHLTIAPVELRQKFLSLIARETDNARRGLSAKIVAKMNSLSDLQMIEALYDASQAGVDIRLIIRGICCLRPGVKGLSENIRVRSIIGRYLEHSRIFLFHNNGDPEYYLASADWMMRNLDRRVEVLFPVRSAENRRMIDDILKLQFEDTLNACELCPDGMYRPVVESGKPAADSFLAIYEHLRENERKKTPRRRDFEPVRSVD